MRIIHNMTFSPTELETYRQVVYSNMIDGLREMINILEDFELDLDPANTVSLMSSNMICIRNDLDIRFTSKPSWGTMTLNRVTHSPQRCRPISLLFGQTQECARCMLVQMKPLYLISTRHLCLRQC